MRQRHESTGKAEDLKSGQASPRCLRASMRLASTALQLLAPAGDARPGGKLTWRTAAPETYNVTPSMRAPGTRIAGCPPGLMPA
jgi:hypothetical protein